MRQAEAWGRKACLHWQEILQLPKAQWFLNRWMVAVVNFHWKHSHLITKNPGKPLYIISNLSFCHISGSNQKSQSGCQVAYGTHLQSGGAQKCHIMCKNPDLSSIADLAITVKWLTQYELMYCPHLYALFALPVYAPTVNAWETEYLGEDTLHILLQWVTLLCSWETSMSRNYKTWENAPAYDYSLGQNHPEREQTLQFPLVPQQTNRQLEAICKQKILNAVEKSRHGQEIRWAHGILSWECKSYIDYPCTEMLQARPPRWM
jgi:hypothetical protein